MYALWKKGRIKIYQIKVVSTSGSSGLPFWQETSPPSPATCPLLLSWLTGGGMLVEMGRVIGVTRSTMMSLPGYDRCSTIEGVGTPPLPSVSASPITPHRLQAATPTLYVHPRMNIAGKKNTSRSRYLESGGMDRFSLTITVLSPHIQQDTSCNCFLKMYVNIIQNEVPVVLLF